MKTKELKKILGRKIEKYANEKNAVDSVVIENNKLYVHHVVLKRMELTFVYSLKDKISLPASTLYCMVHPVKNSSSPYNLCEIVTAINKKDLRCCVFPYIENEERLDYCFKQLTYIIDEYLPLLERAMEDETFLQELEDRRFEDIAKCFQLNYEKTQNMLEDKELLDWYIESFESNLVWRMTNEPMYQLFLQGKYEKSKKKYQKRIQKEKAVSYEKLLYDFICQIQEGEYFEAIPIECYSYCQAKKMDMPSGMIEVFVIFFIAWMGLFWGTSKIFFLIAGRNAVFVSGIEWYFNLIFAFSPTLLTSLFYKGKIFKLLHKTDKVDFDNMMVTDRQRKWIGFFIWGFCILAVITNTLLSIPENIAYEDKLYVNEMEEFLKIDFHEYQYKDVEKVYFIKGRYGEGDDYIKRGSYVLVMRDGRQRDLDLFTFFNGNSNVEKYILPYLGEKAENIITVESDRDVQ